MIMLDALLVEDMVLERNLLTSSRSISKLSVLMPAKDYYTIKCGKITCRNGMILKSNLITVRASYVRVTFQPDFSRFSMKSLADDDTARVMERRVIDVAGVNPHSGCAVKRKGNTHIGFVSILRGFVPARRASGAHIL